VNLRLSASNFFTISLITTKTKNFRVFSGYSCRWLSSYRKNSDSLLFFAVMLYFPPVPRSSFAQNSIPKRGR